MKNRLTINELVENFIEDFVVTGLKRGAEQQKEKFIADLVESFCEQFSDVLCRFELYISDDVFDTFSDRVK